jgi:predicted transposase YbfD/YdcC
MPVQETHEAVHRDVQSLFRRPALLDVSLSTAVTLDTKRGRQETRRLTAMGATEAWGEVGFAEYFEWPGLQQIYRLEREVKVLRTGEVSREVEVGFTSLSRKRADAAILLRIRRGHGHIENGVHYVRDMTYDEDRSQVRIGNSPHVHGTLRNLAIALFRRHGRDNIAQAVREIAAHPRRALAWIGIDHS